MNENYFLNDTGLEYLWSQMVARIDSIKKVGEETILVPPDSWEGDASPYIAYISSSLATPNNKLIVGIGSNSTSVQYEAASVAEIIATDQSDGLITIKAFGAKPTIEIPINVFSVG